MARLSDIANGIRKHLERFASDEQINAPSGLGGAMPYYNPMVYRAGKVVSIKYVSYHHVQNLTKREAQEYLDWLDKGNIGKHYKMRLEKLNG